MKENSGVCSEGMGRTLVKWGPLLGPEGPDLTSLFTNPSGWGVKNRMKRVRGKNGSRGGRRRRGSCYNDLCEKRWAWPQEPQQRSRRGWEPRPCRPAGGGWGEGEPGEWVSQ